jgi:hypothetical protein
VRMVSIVKQKFVSNEWAPRVIVAGPFRGIRMNLNRAHQTQLYLGLFERETHRWLKRLSNGIATGIDIGAADGEYTLFFLKNTLASKIYTFEPDPISLSRLSSNLRLNDEVDLARLIISDKFVGRSGLNGVACLDSLANDLQFPCLIKMDVDGAEAEILAGASAINAMPEVRWLIETHSEELERSCIKSLQSAGFKTEIIRNAWWRAIIPEQRPIPHNRWLVAWKAARGGRPTA